jgi:hypothetical protein
MRCAPGSSLVCARVGPSLLSLLCALVVVVATLLSRPARAQPPDPELLARLALHAAGIEAMRTRASYLVEGELDSIDSDGKLDGVEKTIARVETDGHRPRLVVIKSTEDGKDTTEDARREARTGDQKTMEQRARDNVEMPFASAAQPHYVFDQVATDPRNPGRVEIAFVPRDPSEHTSEGSAWVDATTGTLLSAGFKLSKPGFFVDYVHVTIEFGEKSELGPAISRVTIDGKGGFLFFRKHFRGQVILSNYRIVP